MPSRASTVAFLTPRPRRECDDMTMPSLIDLAAGAALAASYPNPWNS